jgi:SAM-dependent methyltransferase
MSDLHAGFQRADADARGDGLFAFLERVDGLPQVQAIKRRMAELLGPSAGQHLLEVGCGMGHEVRRLAGRVAPGGSVLGIDMNHAMIEEARRRTADLGGAVRCQVGDVQRLELGDDAVDGVRTGPDVCPRSAAGDQRAGPGCPPWRPGRRVRAGLRGDAGRPAGPGSRATGA